MLTKYQNLKLGKAKLFKIIQSGRSPGAWLGKFADQLMKVTFPLAKHVSAPLAVTTSASVILPAIPKNAW